LRGLSSCDGIRRTPWQTVLATEENGSGQAYEILDPLASTNLTVADRSAPAGAPGAVVDPDGADAALQVVKRDALPTVAWEGLDVTPEGVVYAGDEHRPGTGTADSDGGAVFKFVPSVPHTGGPVASLSESPLAAGSVWAFRASCRASPLVQYGQGCEVGAGGWVEVAAASARADADALGATGYYRPEDGHLNPTYGGPGIEYCWTNTGDDGAQHFGEVVCMTDAEPLSSASVPVAQRFVEGDATFNSFDNLDFQPRTGILYVLEDHVHGEVYACLPDGADRDLKTDGCVAVLGVKDPSAEPTGFRFAGDGTTAVLSIQHSNDGACQAPGSDCANVDDYATDDIVMISGFEIRPGMLR
jgi:secreted PhoX family phosphatase